MSRFYQQNARLLLVLLVIAFPALVYYGETMSNNNDIETWLPTVSDVRTKYEDFKELFGAEEVILVGLPNVPAGDPIVEALAGRLENLEGIRECWSPHRLRNVMRNLEVPDHVIESRIRGLAVSGDASIVGVLALLSKEGLADREGTVRQVKKVLNYCQLEDDDVLLTGAPVVVSELNRLGSTENSRGFFALTLGISLVLLYSSLRNWYVSCSILLITLVAIELTNSLVKFSGGEMNFILSAMPVMVLVFTLSTAVHFVHYYRTFLDCENPLEHALRRAWKPCGLSTITTAIGLLSLMVSEIAPVRQFGFAGAIGAVVAMACGLGITPLIFVFAPDCVSRHVERREEWGVRLAHRIISDKGRIALACSAAAILCGIGLMSLEAKIDPLDFLPAKSEVVRDLIKVEQELTNVESIEAVVDFGTDNLAFTEKLNRVRELEQRIGSHPAVRHTMSLASFFPEELPSRPMDAARLYSKAQENSNRSDYVSAGERFWRISARVQGESTSAKEKAFRELGEMMVGEPVHLTGIAPLLEHAQREIFQGFWESFASAFFVITCIMALAFRSPLLAVTAMLPNLFPIAVVFGLMGWMGMSVDIGITMTASIALGIAVDGTFHYVITYQKRLREGMSGDRAAWNALVHNGEPILQAAIITSMGMLALTSSSFSPTVRFGWLMATILMVAVVGDLAFLPALVALKTRRRGRTKRNRAVQTLEAAPVPELASRKSAA